MDPKTWTMDAGESRARGADAWMPERYERISFLGEGGMGEVLRVRDLRLGSTVAMKISKTEVARDLSERRRFLDEARLTAQLHHPDIVAVYDMGELEDGRLFFTMEEVRGRTLQDLIDEVHNPRARSEWTLRRLVEVFRRICVALNYAHSRGILHRDLKPSNLMVGDLGEVKVMDWGLARLDEDEETEERFDLGERSGSRTMVGEIKGTPAYMSPEQALGQSAMIGVTTDVYALGAVLFAILSGRDPYIGDGWAVLDQIQQGVTPDRLDRDRAPAALCDIAERAMQALPRERYPNAGALAQVVADWLAEARRRERALEVVEGADALLPGVSALRAEADQARADAAEVLEPLQPFAPVSQKLPGWTLEERAQAAEREARLQELEMVQRLRSALTIEPQLREAHERLADHYRARLEAAEQQRDTLGAEELEVLLRTHDRGRHTEWLRGDGALTLVTDPPGAEVELHEFVMRDRRLVTERRRPLGRTPLRKIPLRRGSYLLLISHPEGGEPVRYPVMIDRAAHWDGVPPDGDVTHPIHLPAPGEVGEDDCYVPAGWFWSGGDPEAVDGLPLRSWWVGGFVIDRFPVTHTQYLAFLNDLVERGRGEEALRWAPREADAGAEEEERSNYSRGEGGRFNFAPDWRGRGGLDTPINLISWWAASAYAQWRAEQDGLPWRLPHDLEWEKAARGVDRRLMPWGDFAEPTWSCNTSSQSGPPVCTSVTGYASDEGPYGVRGMAGNVRTWCQNPYIKGGAPRSQATPEMTTETPSEETFLMIRGGGWNGIPRVCRVAGRYANRPHHRMRPVGVRLVRSLG